MTENVCVIKIIQYEMEGSVKGKKILQEVVLAAANSYRWSGTGPVRTQTDNPKAGFNIELPKIRRLEKVCTGTKEIDTLDTNPIKKHRENGVEFWVLVPLEDMGKAHNRLRGYADRIQPWWFDPATKKVKFGTAEMP